MKKCVKNNKGDLFIVEYNNISKKIVSVKDPDTNIFNFIYDEKGKLIKVLKNRVCGYGNNVYSLYEYDNNGKLIYYWHFGKCTLIYDGKEIIHRRPKKTRS